MRPIPVSNPPNPFSESLVEYFEDVAALREQQLQVFEDHTQQILAKNDSPDIGFTYSVNPYRGCFHACAYCLSGETRVLMGDGSTKRLADLKVGDEVIGTERRGRVRRYVKTRVLDHWLVTAPAYRVELDCGTVLIASAEHRFLSRRGWRCVARAEGHTVLGPPLVPGARLLGPGGLGELMERGDWESGSRFAASSSRGPRRAGERWGSLRIRAGHAGVGSAHVGAGHADVGAASHVRGRKVCARRAASRVRGKLCLELPPRNGSLEGRVVTGAGRVVKVEALGLVLPLYDITTGTGDFVANGVVSHNCYARPTHEYLSFGAGTDFERKIVVKPNAPSLLRAAFEKRSWKGELIMLSGNTDCYQPLENTYRLTRGLLEVCAEYRNPVHIITKSPLIERDIDVLQKLAAEASVGVSISIPFWTEATARALEPFVTTPARRMKTVERLSQAGIPVTVNIAPLVLGFGDRDVPKILEAAAAAGAQGAALIPLRLPGSVKEVFSERLRAAFPLSAEKVLKRTREMRGGKLYDAEFGRRMRGEGEFFETVRRMFDATCQRLGLNQEPMRGPLRTGTFRRPTDKNGQLRLF